MKREGVSLSKPPNLRFGLGEFTPSSEKEKEFPYINIIKDILDKDIKMLEYSKFSK